MEYKIRPQVVEFRGCAHCREAITSVRAGEDESLFYCEPCQQAEPDTVTLWLNEDTEEVTDSIEQADQWELDLQDNEG